ncbi:hypothetical protein chiPu_0017309 [Chiloscyllium punctatum]|uniref:Uncharacterized protein n=1 Tax=Chiloscyllium punctatum TaxID=137246 RepID=A0A401RET4_CHIPU|nr:hypothetical protein [Chiloscyllium punctatum]
MCLDHCHTATSESCINKRLRRPSLREQDHRGLGRVLSDMESQKDITTWESFRAKTKPFLQNLKKGKMLSKRKEGKKRHLLDQRMSVSEPDMVQVGKTYSESCSRVIVKTSAINYFSSPSTPVKKRDQVMAPQISVSPGQPQKPENSCPEKEACTPTTLPELVKETSSNSAEDLVERSFYLGTDDKYAVGV